MAIFSLVRKVGERYDIIGQTALPYEFLENVTSSITKDEDEVESNSSTCCHLPVVDFHKPVHNVHLMFQNPHIVLKDYNGHIMRTCPNDALFSSSKMSVSLTPKKLKAVQDEEIVCKVPGIAIIQKLAARISHEFLILSLDEGAGG